MKGLKVQNWFKNKFCKIEMYPVTAPISLKLYVTAWVEMFTALTFLASACWMSCSKKETIKVVLFFISTASLKPFYQVLLLCPLKPFLPLFWSFLNNKRIPLFSNIKNKSNIIWHPLYVESKRNDTSELTYKTERDSQTQRMSLLLPEAGMG